MSRRTVKVEAYAIVNVTCPDTFVGVYHHKFGALGAARVIGGPRWRVLYAVVPVTLTYTVPSKRRPAKGKLCK